MLNPSLIKATLQADFDAKNFLEFAKTIAGDGFSDWKNFVISDQYFSEDLQNRVEKILVGSDMQAIQAIQIFHICVKETELKNTSERRKIAQKCLEQSGNMIGIFAFTSTKTDVWRFALVENFGDFQKTSKLKEFYARANEPIKTAQQQLEVFFQGKKIADFGERVRLLQEAFSVEAISDDFYKKFKPHFDALVDSITGNFLQKTKEDFVLLFVIRILFLGFVQKKGWLGKDEKFLQNFLAEYLEKNSGKNEFYKKWLEPLFFEALNSPIGSKVAYQSNHFSPQTENLLQMFPYLNGGLFQSHKNFDGVGMFLEDEHIKNFFDFLFGYNFTIQENTTSEESLELSPELLGIIFERLVNGENGAVYTGRTEVDLMCRLSLVKFLEENNETQIELRDLYELFFPEKGHGKDFEADQKEGSFSAKQVENILEKLETIAICDPAVGSGAFPVGMIQVLDEVEISLKKRIFAETEKSAFDRKKRIIAKNLYGVEVKEWAMWITQLRLWISLFVDAPDELKNSLVPILPSLDFKIRCGDSLVQQIAGKNFPVDAHAHLSASLKGKITKLKNAKTDFFLNKTKDAGLIKHQELDIFREILDEELCAKRQKIAEIQDRQKTVAEQGTLFGESGGGKKAKQISLFEEEIETLKAEMTELEKQKNSLSADKKPLVWNIEFAEIFSEKGGFDIVIGNPPYIRQEQIGDPNGKLENLEYKEALVEMIRADFFATKSTSDFKKISAYDGRTDLSVYFYFRAIKLLNPTGISSFICTNSWLDTGYGGFLQKFLLEKVPLHFVIDNHAKRSFAGAAVNTIISVFGSVQKKQKNDILKFVAFKKPFEEVIFTEHLLEMENAKTTLTNEKMRVLPMERQKLLEEGQGDDPKTYAGDKWGGKYLRAPQFFLNFLKEKNLIPFSKIVEMKYGVKPGKVKFFFLTKEKAEELEIEKEFLLPAVVSSQKIKNLFISSTHYIFSSTKSKEEMKGTNALKYIEWGEKNGMNIGKSVEAHRPFWYSLSGESFGTLFFRFWDRRFFSPVSTEKMWCSDNFCYGVFPKNEWAGKILVNSTFYFLQIEIFGNSNQGQGVLTTYMEFDYPFIKFPQISPNDEIYKEILENLNKREIKSIFEECGIDPHSKICIAEQTPNPLPDRKKLDDIVFDALKLSADERTEIYRAVCQLVWNRVSKSKSV